ncbi:hypothetical protein PCASD_20200 [Puccinia coronata f. sp. avenae]|uniref:Uncharacterized protein n=1 Tax=Puccinia coronata f. sp. avenae TaxID=200324 RepID=A0A2N5SMX2_9BASI|nr:hypothetical protein PCASD_20200 [Puccinia coronata f. sp. avenae]
MTGELRAPESRIQKKNCNQNQQTIEPEPPDKPQRFRFKNFGKYHLKSIASLMEKAKQSRPRSYASEESVKEIQRNVRIASEVRKPSSTYRSLSDVAEAKVTRGRSTKPQLANPGAKERELSHKPEQSDLPPSSDLSHPSEPNDLHPSSWRRVRNIFANKPNGMVVPSNHAYPALPPETFEINRLLGTKSLPPPSAIAVIQINH